MTQIYKRFKVKILRFKIGTLKWHSQNWYPCSLHHNKLWTSSHLGSRFPPRQYNIPSSIYLIHLKYALTIFKREYSLISYFYFLLSFFFVDNLALQKNIFLAKNMLFWGNQIGINLIENQKWLSAFSTKDLSERYLRALNTNYCSGWLPDKSKISFWSKWEKIVHLKGHE